MEKVALLCGGGKKAIESHAPKTLSQLEPSPAIPLWLDLQCPSERLRYDIWSLMPVRSAAFIWELKKEKVS